VMNDAQLCSLGDDTSNATCSKACSISRIPRYNQSIMTSRPHVARIDINRASDAIRTQIQRCPKRGTLPHQSRQRGDG